MKGIGIVVGTRFIFLRVYTPEIDRLAMTLIQIHFHILKNELTLKSVFLQNNRGIDTI